MQQPIAASDLHASVCPSQADLAHFEQLSGIERREFRDDTIEDCTKAITKKYNQFKLSLHQEAVGTALTTDVLSLGLTAGSVLSGGGTAKALGQAGTFFIGAGTAINKDVFYQETLPAIEASMDAKRDTILKTILDSEKSDPAATSYTLTSAGYDIAAYEGAGNLYAAISELTKTASVNADTAKNAVTESQNAPYFVSPIDPAIYPRLKKNH